MKFETYEATLDFLFAQLPMFTRIGAPAYKEGLGNIEALCAHIGHPERKIKTIHVAGSNGKGSVSHMLAATFQAAGYKTGLHTSPHLVDIRERFRINGQLIDKTFIHQFINQHYDFIQQLQPSYFELNVAMAFQVFFEQGVDIAIIETGLGGRLDSTNIITPELSVITNISLEHTALLGDTLQKIAAEKAGIIKPNIPVIIGETQAETEQIFFLKAHQSNAPITYADAIWDTVRVGLADDKQMFKLINKSTLEMHTIETDLMGAYQSHNITTAAAAISALQHLGWDVDITVFSKALQHIISATGLKGRWETISHQPKIIIDVAHNPAGIEFLKDNLANNAITGKTYFILGFASDKDVDAVIKHFPKEALYIFTQAKVERAMPVASLVAKANKNGIEGISTPNLATAISKVLALAQPEDTIIITGSFFTVADALEVIQK